ncbi:MAG: energy-coupling factor ABC transporter ATP-binding protein [Anaerolineae bacterium]|jgi:cobalt/nickel transport system ATP-binding protein
MTGAEQSPDLEIGGLSYTYPSGQAALRDVSLRVWPGERVALVGPNGAGKSTLMLHLNGILAGTGEVRVAGVVVGEGTKRAVRAMVGLVFQNPDDQLFSLRVIEDVAFGPLQEGMAPAEARNRAMWALEQVGMAAMAERAPHQLSLGERKRVAIATVLAMQPRLLVLDEPTAGLDPRGRRELIALLRSMPQTLLVATHDMRLVWELCPRTVIMDGGRVVADGATAELLADAELLEAHGLETPWQGAPPADMVSGPVSGGVNSCLS